MFHGQCRYKYLVLGMDKSNFVKKKRKRKTLILLKSSVNVISSKCFKIWLTTYLFYLVDMFFKTVSIPMGTNCAPFLADLFHYSYEADFIQGFFKKTEKKASPIFQFHIQLYRWCILNNSKFDDFVDDIYPIELEIKDTTNTARSASFFDLCIKIDSDVRLRTKRCGKRDDFHFPIMNFPFICSNNSSSTCIWIDRQTTQWPN